MKRMKKALLIVIVALTAAVLAACGGEEEDMTLQNEEWEEISISGKDKPTVFFHFTGVG
ncbi:hypothetical protein SAMN05192534_11835 [Alteribacillus persepolensis]|uniref:Uncharacterized protein n=1 Tax=Alteribacillus persepolensis TaxID=568899 RepID=A0A1G8H3C6_9BACI|nr:hypothetical protein [Alteribacillus persepolensis]SDI01144.1 hypothetical protein SAMN05192534_11835 [Alteribacillus persepolensis]